MNPASTALAAYTVTPNTRPSSRSHSSWYTSPESPEAKKSRAIVARWRRVADSAFSADGGSDDADASPADAMCRADCTR